LYKKLKKIKIKLKYHNFNKLIYYFKKSYFFPICFIPKILNCDSFDKKFTHHITRVNYHKYVKINSFINSFN